jgi:glycosyltransferase involved in cell wall biosynthesis
VISIIVPAYNEERGLAATLARIRQAAAAFEQAGFCWELIVCDNNSTDSTAAIAENAGARVVFEPINQIARARNTGASHAAGEWLLFVDADSHPSRELCADAARAMRSGRCLAGGTTMMVAADEPRWVRAVIALWNGVSRLARCAAGSFLFCRASTFRDLGGFNERMFVSEDIDFCKRLRPVARGSRLAIVILHDHPLRTSARKAHLYTGRELASWYFKTLITAGRTLRSARDCPIWYDGRR